MGSGASGTPSFLTRGRYTQISELHQWNAELAGLPLEWPAAAQLGGVIALCQRPQRSDIIIGGFAGCAQVGQADVAHPRVQGEQYTLHNRRECHA